MRLYSSTRRMTTMFCTSIICITLAMLMLRLTVFSDMATAVAADSPETVDLAGGEIESGDSEFPYRLNGKIYFSKSTAKGNVLILNPEANRYLLSINIVLPETKDSLYYTGSLAPGTPIDSARLSAAGQKLPDGEYRCIAEISAIDPETQTKVVTVEEEVTIYIGKKPQS